MTKHVPEGVLALLYAAVIALCAYGMFTTKTIPNHLFGRCSTIATPSS